MSDVGSEEVSETPASEVTQTSVMHTVRALRPLFSAYPWGIPVIVFLGVVSSLAEGIGLSLFVPLFDGLDDTGVTTDSGEWWVRALRAPFEDMSRDDRVLAIGACIFGAIVIRALLGYANNLVFAWLDAHIGHGLRSDIFDRLLEVDYRYIERTSFGSLINTLGTETWRTSGALGSAVQFLISIVNIVVYVALLLLISAKLTIAVGLAMAFIALLVRVLTRQVGALGRQVTTANQVLASRMVEGLSLMEVIRTFGRERYEHQRFDHASRRVSDLSLRLSFINGAISPVYQILSGVLLVGVTVVSLRGTGDVASLLVFIFVLYRLQPQVTALDGTTTNLRSLAGAVDDVTSLLDETAEQKPLDGKQRHKRLTHSIRADDLSFTYEDDEPPALEGVSVEIPAGKVTALVGPSGAGKSTLIKLLFRFYDPGSGQILIDDDRLADLELSTWRDGIALVSQDVQLFDASVADNIGYGRPDATDDEIVAAAIRADAHEFILQLPLQYDTPVGDLGVRLSGGQKQRITLARAIVRDPELLILDEATNALDSRSERIIQDALDNLSENRTVIVIAHRFSTIQRADHVIVFDNGRVSESGDRETLLAGDGLFRHLTDLQNSAIDGASPS